MNYLWIDCLSMSDFFLGFLLFFFVHYFNYLKDLYFYILFCFWNEIDFSLIFLSLTIVDLSMNEWFYLRTVRAIAKARKIVQISICVFDLQRYIYVILSKNQSDISFLKECLLFIFRCFVILMVVYRREKSKSEIYIWDDFLWWLIVL